MSWLRRWYRRRCERIDRDVLVPALREAGERRGLVGKELDDVVAVGVVLAQGDHFSGCPTPVGQPYDCDFCQERARSMAQA